jgi:L-threonylcarbamoyladenylate synthase
LASAADALDKGAAGAVGASVIVRTIDDALVERVAQRWRAAGLVAFPTETVYGLGADAEQAAAVQAIFNAKGRPANHPLIVHFADPQNAEFWIDARSEVLNLQRFRKLSDAFWPGPLTMIMPRRPQTPAFACAGQDSIGLRCPAHPLAQRLLASFARAGGQGIAAPSANRFGRISPTTAEHVLSELADHNVLVVDGGASSVGVESSIVDLTRAQPVLLRPGRITAEEMAEVLSEPVLYSSNVINPAELDQLAPRASGTLVSHYAPQTPLQIVKAADLPALRTQFEQAGTPVAVLLCTVDATKYAHELYARLRELDASACARILVQAPPQGRDWRAVWDRLLRAQTRP